MSCGEPDARERARPARRAGRGNGPAATPAPRPGSTQPLASILEVHDPGLGVLELKAQLRQDQPQRRKRRLGLLPRSAHHKQIVRETDQNPMPAVRPLPVKPVQIDVAQARRNYAALRGSRHFPRDRPVLHHPCAQHRAQQLQDVPVADPLLDHRHQPIVRNRPEAVRDVRLRDPPPAVPRLIDEDLERVVL